MSKASILIVDDDSAIQKVLTMDLQEIYEVQCASTPDEAVQKVQQAAGMIDVAIVDMRFGNGWEGGLQVIQRVRALESPPEIVVLTGYGSQQNTVRCMEAGAFSYVTKTGKRVDGEVTGLLMATLERALRVRTLRKSEIELTKLKEDLVNYIVHDLRTPLTSLLTGMQTLGMDQDLQDHQQEIIDISIQGAQVLVGMINDLLDISKMEDGSLRLEYEEISSAEIIQAAASWVAPLAREKYQQLLLPSPESTITFSGDRQKLIRVLTNLLGNAVKFCPEHRTISVSVNQAIPDDSASEPYLHFSVVDTGDGIPEDAFHIILIIGQVEMRNQGQKMSTGLGLSFCKMIVEAHDGNIWVESELGKGSTFSFKIPKLSTGH